VKRVELGNTGGVGPKLKNLRRILEAVEMKRS
jgi:hypothetical protein